MIETIAAPAEREIDWSTIPAQFRPLHGKLSAVCRSKEECADLVHWWGLGPEYCPFKPVLLLVPGAPQQIAGLGQATAAEIRDQAVAVWELIAEDMSKRGRPVDFDDLRERASLRRKEDVDTDMREGFWDRIQRHKAAPRTDPPRQPHYVRVNEKTVHPISGFGRKEKRNAPRTHTPAPDTPDTRDL